MYMKHLSIGENNILEQLLIFRDNVHIDERLETLN